MGLFDFLSVSEEIVKQYHSSEINESKCRIDFVTLLAPAAKLLGTESSEELLLPAFQRYMSDSSDVQNALLSQLFTFCKVLSPKSREIVLRDLSQLFSIDMDARCWRQRAVFANTFIQVEWRDQKDLWRRRTEHMSDAIPVTVRERKNF
uniref:MMS19 nucleotide excision repair protein n=1 Tax=Meloidogyne javanica TaxID=6303 RepID=A0A915MNS7_MELJA